MYYIPLCHPEQSSLVILHLSTVQFCPMYLHIQLLTVYRQQSCTGTGSTGSTSRLEVCGRANAPSIFRQVAFAEARL